MILNKTANGVNLLRHNFSMVHSVLGVRSFAFHNQVYRPAQFGLMSSFSRAPFSQFFRDMDEASVKQIERDLAKSPEYEWRQAEWKDAVAKKARKREEKRLRDEAREPAEEQDAIVYVHNAELGVTIPAAPDQIFAVVRLLGLQHKVVLNDKLLVEQMPFEVGQQICLDDVLMVGTADYTAIGRPNV